MLCMLVSTPHRLIVLGQFITLFAGKSDIALQHTAVEPGGFILEDTFLLVEAKKDLSTEALVQICLIAVSWSCLLQRPFTLGAACLARTLHFTLGPAETSICTAALL